MIPSNSISYMYAKILGDQALLAIAQNNLLHNLEHIGKIGNFHTFFAFNGQTRLGTSRNSGKNRYYSWEDTLINCQSAPNLIDNGDLDIWIKGVGENPKFIKFKNNLEQRFEDFITVKPFYETLRGEDNMRYNIKLDTKIEDFDSIRVGIQLTALNKTDFQLGLKALKAYDNPLKINKNISKSNLQ